MSKKIHVCLVCNEYPKSNHGGIGSFTKDLAEGLIENNFNVTVIGVYSEYVLSFKEVITENINGVNVYRYPFKHILKNKRLNYIYNRYFLKKMIKKLHKKDFIDIIEAPEHDGWLPFGTPYNILLITRLHSSVTLLGQFLNKKYSRLISIFEKFQLKKSNHIISVSNFTAQTTLNIFKLKKNYKVIYNSIKIPKGINKVKVDTSLMLYAGSISEKKGITELFQAMAIVFSKYPDVKLVLAGKNNYIINGENYEEYLRRFIKKEYQNNITFKGILEREKELIPLIQKAYFCCFPSHVEAFSLAPIEAMALEKAVIFTKYVSGPELIDDGISGLLADTKDPNDIASKILQLLDDEKLCTKLAMNGKKRVDEMFSYNKWIDENVRFYKEVLDEK